MFISILSWIAFWVERSMEILKERLGISRAKAHAATIVDQLGLRKKPAPVSRAARVTPSR